MSNLLDFTELVKPSSAAEVYVVFNGVDYRMTLKTLLTLVTAASISLDKVDNTSDVDKPISKAQLEALAEKANKTDVVSQEAFNILADSLKNYVTVDTLKAAIAGITDSLNGYLTKDEGKKLISDSLSNIASTVDALSKQVADNASAMVALDEKTKTMVVEQTMNEAIAQSKTAIESEFSMFSSSVNQAIDALAKKIDNFNTVIDGFQQALNAKADKQHSHETSEINGLEAYVKSLIGSTTGEVQIGAVEW